MTPAQRNIYHCHDLHVFRPLAEENMSRRDDGDYDDLCPGGCGEWIGDCNCRDDHDSRAEDTESGHPMGDTGSTYTSDEWEQG